MPKAIKRAACITGKPIGHQHRVSVPAQFFVQVYGPQAHCACRTGRDELSAGDIGAILACISPVGMEVTMAAAFRLSVLNLAADGQGYNPCDKNGNSRRSAHDTSAVKP